jgi:hypothetical protein
MALLMTEPGERADQDPERKRPLDDARVVLSGVEGRRQCMGVGHLRQGFGAQGPGAASLRAR